MKLIPNARRVALRSASLWINRLAFALMILPELVFLWTGIDTNPILLFWAGAGLYVAVEIARLVDQGIGDRLRSPAIIALIAMASIFAAPPPPADAAEPAYVTQEQFIKVAVPLVGKWEGKKNQAYLDRIASPPVWTVCNGETRGVRAGDYHTDAECAAMLGKGLLEFRRDLHNAFTDTTLQHRLTPKRDAAYVSLAYNAGVYAISRSTAVRRLNAGNIVGGCHAIAWWNKAGNRVIRGLVNRRTEEVKYCLEGAA